MPHRHGVGAAIIVLLFVVVSATARAHGPSLSIDDVLTWVDAGEGAGDAVRPNLVRLLRGAARWEPDGLRYICPARWGGTEAPPMVAAGDAVYVAGVLRVARIDAAGEVTTLTMPEELEAPTLRALATDGVRVAGLTTKGALVMLAPGAPRLLATYDPPPDALAILDDAIVLAVEDGGTLELAQVRELGSEVVRDAPFYRGPYRASPALVRLARDGSRLWLRGTNNEGQRLERVAFGAEGADATLVPIATSGETIEGPVAYGNALWLVVGGQPRRLDGDVVISLPETTRLFCLREHPALGLLVCLTSDLHRYVAATGVGEAYLALPMLRPPSLDGLDATDELGCRADWMDAAADAGLPPELQRPPAWFPGEGELDKGVESSDVAEPDAASEPDGSEPAPDLATPSDEGCAGGPLMPLWLALAGLVACARSSRR